MRLRIESKDSTTGYICELDTFKSDSERYSIISFARNKDVLFIKFGNPYDFDECCNDLLEKGFASVSDYEAIDFWFFDGDEDDDEDDDEEAD